MSGKGPSVFEKFVDKLGDDFEVEDATVVKILQFLREYATDSTDALSNFLKEFYDQEKGIEVARQRERQLVKTLSDLTISNSLLKGILKQQQEDYTELEENIEFQDSVNRSFKNLLFKDRRDFRITMVCYEKMLHMLECERAADLEDCMNEIEQVRSDLAEYAEDASFLESQLEASNTYQESLETKLSQYELAVDAFDDQVRERDNKIEELEAKLARYEYEVAVARQQLDSEMLANEGVHHMLEKQAEQLNDSLEMEIALNNHLSQNNYDMEIELRELRIERVLLKKLSLIQMSESVPRSWVKAEQERHKNYVYQLEDEMVSVKTDNAILKESNYDMSMQLRELNAQLEILHSSVIDTNADYDQQQQELETAEDRIADLQHENVIMRGEVDKLMKRLAELDEQTVKIAEENVDLVEKLDESDELLEQLSDENVCLKQGMKDLIEEFSYAEKGDLEAIKDLRERLSESITKCRTLEGTICELKAEIAGFQVQAMDTSSDSEFDIYDEDFVLSDDDVAEYLRETNGVDAGVSTDIHGLVTRDLETEELIREYEEQIAEYEQSMSELFTELSHYEELKRKYSKLQADYLALCNPRAPAAL